MMRSRRNQKKVLYSTSLEICGGDDKTMLTLTAFCLMTRNAKPTTAWEARMMTVEGDYRWSRSGSFQNDMD